MAESTLGVSITTMNQAIALELGYSLDSTDWSSTMLTQVNHVRQSAERSVYFAMMPDGQGQYEWSFLNPPATLDFVAGDSAYDLPDDFMGIGAIGQRLVYAAASGYVSAEKVDSHSLLESQAKESGSTLAAAITSAGDLTLTVASAKYFPVTLTPFTIQIDSEYLRVTACSGTTFTVTRGYASTTATTHSSGATVTLLGPPKKFAVRPNAATPDAAEGQRYELLVFPTPDAAYTVNYRYTIHPNAVTTALPYPYGGTQHGETFMLACRARAELLIKGEPGPMTAAFLSQLGSSISMDRRARKDESENFPVAPATLGSYAWIAQGLGQEIGLGANPALWTWSEQESVRRYIQQGCIEVYKPALDGNKLHRGFRWSFLSSLTTLTTSAPQSSSTVTIVDGVVTLAAGTWPSWAAQGTLVIDGVCYEVATRDSSTQLTLQDTTVDADALTTYTLARYRYTLTSGFSALDHSMISFQPGQGYEQISLVHPQRITNALQDGYYSSYPLWASVRTQTPSTSGTTRELIFFPYPNDAYLLTYKFKRPPLEINDGDTPLGGLEHANLFLAAAKAQYKPKEFHADFIQQLSASIETDMNDHQSYSLGENSDFSDNDWSMNRRHWRVDITSLFGVAQ